jgi:hypothetical protein
VKRDLVTTISHSDTLMADDGKKESKNKNNLFLSESKFSFPTVQQT